MGDSVTWDGDGDVIVRVEHHEKFRTLVNSKTPTKTLESLGFPDYKLHLRYSEKYSACVPWRLIHLKTEKYIDIMISGSKVSNGVTYEVLPWTGAKTPCPSGLFTAVGDYPPAKCIWKNCVTLRRDEMWPAKDCSFHNITSKCPPNTAKVLDALYP